MIHVIVKILIIHQMINCIYSDEMIIDNKNNESKLKQELSYDYIDNEIDMKLTYISGIEKFFKVILATIQRSDTNGIVEIIVSYLPESFRFFLLRSNLTKVNDTADKGFGDILNIFRDDFQAVFPGKYIKIYINILVVFFLNLKSHLLFKKIIKELCGVVAVTLPEVMMILECFHKLIFVVVNMIHVLTRWEPEKVWDY